MNAAELETVVEKSKAVFKKLNEKYNKLSGYLVFSSPYGKCELTSNLSEILNIFPQMITECKHKEKGLHLLQKINDIETENKKSSGNPKSSEKFRIQLNEIVKNLKVNEDTFVEIRFKRTDLDLIFELQKEELISQEHTPQTKASIRIILGTLRDLQ